MKGSMLIFSIAVLNFLNPCLAQNTKFLSKNLPGRPETPIYYTNLGDTELFFYLSAKKQSVVRELLREINNENILLAPEVNTFETTTKEISAVASRFPSTEDWENPSGIRDPIGVNILDKFKEDLQTCIEFELGFNNLQAVSRELNFIVNQDAHNFHKDQSLLQFKFLSNNNDNLSGRYHIFQDLTLIDWDMSPGTISGTIFQDPLSEDRFIIPLFPEESVGMVFAEHNENLDSSYHSSYGFPTIFPFHAVLSPIDFYPDLSCGSSKGKRLSSVLRGVVETENIENLKEKSIRIEFPRYTHLGGKLGQERHYSNEMVSIKIPAVVPEKMKLLLKSERVEVDRLFVTDSRLEVISLSRNQAKQVFNIIRNYPINRIKNKTLDSALLLKKSGEGFSSLRELIHLIPKNSDLLIINVSDAPSSYSLYQLSEDLTQIGYPWIRLVHTPLDRVIIIKIELLDCLSITPSEEIIHRALDNKAKNTKDRLKSRIEQKFLILTLLEKNYLNSQ